jgi:hypothetical protein
MPPDRRPPRGGRLVPSVLGALWCKPHLTVPQRVPLQCARPWGGEAGPSRQWRGVSPPNGTGRCWSHGPGERCRRVNTCPATPPRQETLASSRPFDAIGPAPAPGWALPGDAAIALYGARHPQRHRFLQRCNAPARGAVTARTSCTSPASAPARPVPGAVSCLPRNPRSCPRTIPHAPRPRRPGYGCRCGRGRTGRGR